MKYVNGGFANVLIASKVLRNNWRKSNPPSEAWPSSLSPTPMPSDSLLSGGSVSHSSIASNPNPHTKATTTAQAKHAQRLSLLLVCNLLLTSGNMVPPALPRGAKATSCQSPLSQVYLCGRVGAEVGGICYSLKACPESINSVPAFSFCTKVLLKAPYNSPSACAQPK